MFQHEGIWLPDGERHLVQWLSDKRKCPTVDGRGSYQINKLRRALEFTPADRRRRAIDIGAHVGLWSMQLAKVFEQVACFEPLAAHRACWRDNVVNLAAVLYDCALGAWCEPDGVRLTTPSAASSGDSFVGANGAVTGDRVEVADLCTLDSFGFVEVDFVKIDCEGYELFALQGAEATLQRWRPTVIVEQKPGKAEKYGLGEQDAVAWLEALGAKLRDVLAGDYILSWD